MLERVRLNVNAFLPLEGTKPEQKEQVRTQSHTHNVTQSHTPTQTTTSTSTHTPTQSHQHSPCLAMPPVCSLPSPSPPLCVCLSKMSQDEEAVRVVGKFLWDVVVPGFLDEVKRGNTTPMDGHMLTDLLHQSGINVRYIGTSRLTGAEQEL